MRKILITMMLALLSATMVDAFASSGAEQAHKTYTRKAPIFSNDGKMLHAVILKDPPLALQVFEKSGKQTGAQRKQALAQESSKAYRSMLKSRQADFIGRAGEKIGRKPSVVREYQLAANAVILALSPAEANAVREMQDVAAVNPVQRHFPQTDRGPSHIGAPAMWAGTAAAGLAATKGEGMIVGVIDTGIRPEHPSFADVGGDGYDHVNPLGAGVYLGDCALPEAAHYCNDKLIGIVSYPEITDTFAGDAPPYGLDYEGHGTHVASTVAGNVVHNVPSYGPTGVLGEYEFPEISGVAPHANIVSYQICHQGDRGWGCDTMLTVAAVEHAIENGIDVINYSIGGWAEDPWFSIDGMAFLSARAAGIHVAVSAGNAGPEWRTVSSPATAPWVTSVAAYTHDRSFSDITFGNFAGGNTAPAVMTGRGVTNGYTGPIVRAADFGDAMCLFEFQPGTFAGEIVVCERGENARVAKGVNVLAGGAGGMVLINVDPAADDIVADFHALPAIHLNVADGAALMEWLAEGAGHTAEISATTIGTDPALADHAAVFSSRGPAFPYADMLTPHVAAPGVGIYAAFTDDQRFSPEPVESPYAMLDGTSMASPHVAGAMTLLTAVHPDWTPAEMHSALMLTSVANTHNDLGEASLPFDQGAGRIDIVAAANAGLVMDVSESEYLAADPNQGGDPATLNMPSFAEDECLLECSWTRRFRAVKAGSWTVSANVAVDDAEVSVEPAAFTVAAGEEVEVTVTMRLTSDSAVARWVFGEVRMQSLDASVPEHHLPIAASMMTAVFPGAKFMNAQRDADTQVIDGMYSRASDALEVEARAIMATLHDDVELVEDTTPEEPLDNIDDGNSYWKMFTVASRSDAIFAEVFDVGADVDLFIARDADGNGRPSQSELDNNLACISATFSGYEYCAAHDLEPGDYWVLIHNSWSEPGATIQPPFYTALLQGAGTLDVSATGPATVAHGEDYAVDFSWDIHMEYHDVAFGMVTVGDDGYSGVGNIGNIPVRLERLRDDVRVMTVAETASRGEAVSYMIRVDANFQSVFEPREYVIELELPELVELVSVDGDPQRAGRKLTWNVSQEPFGSPHWINITVRPHKVYTLASLNLDVSHRLANGVGKTEVASAPIIRITDESGGGSLDYLLILVLLVSGLGGVIRQRETN